MQFRRTVKVNKQYFVQYVACIFCLMHLYKGTGILVTQAVESHRVVRRRGSNIFDSRLKGSGQLVSVTRRPLSPPGKFLVLISVRGRVHLRAI
jgi:hypothetical protein